MTVPKQADCSQFYLLTKMRSLLFILDCC